MQDEGMSEWIDYRTFWIPNFEEGDVIQIKERVDGTDYPLCQAEIVSILPVRYQDIDLSLVMVQEQIARYGREFYPGHWFFQIRYRIVREKEELEICPKCGREAPLYGVKYYKDKNGKRQFQMCMDCLPLSDWRKQDEQRRRYWLQFNPVS